MIKIPSGKIQLRDDRKKTSWTVDIKSFLLSSYPVTQKLYFSITQKNPSTFLGDNKPVETVSWLDAVNFCNLLSEQSGLKSCYLIYADGAHLDPLANGYRLPSEAEWEYACRSGSDKVRYGEIGEIAWFEKNSNGATMDVGLKRPNAWGLFDMLGNVWEWCNDLYDEEVYGTYRVFRGGGWSDKERGCLATNRRRSHPTFKIDDLGFRVCRSL